jgi:hypothetical protein
MFIKGQQVNLTSGGNLRITIDSPYDSAWKTYRFPEPSPSISLSEDLVFETVVRECFIVVEFGHGFGDLSGDLNVIKPCDIYSWVRKYDSKESRNGVNLLIFPISIMRKI